MPEVGGVVHTHSTYASAWAARGEAIPCVLTAMADEFGGEIPIGPFALIGGDDIGRGLVDTLKGHRSPAVLMRNHGVFTIGATPKAAVKAAVMCEDVARTVHIARQLGDVVPIEDKTSTRSTTATRTSTDRGAPSETVVSDRQPVSLRRRDPGPGRRPVARDRDGAGPRPAVSTWSGSRSCSTRRRSAT